MYMFLFAALVLLGLIAYLVIREGKRREEWQLEYRYLTRHQPKDMDSVPAEVGQEIDSLSFKRLQDAIEPLANEPETFVSKPVQQNISPTRNSAEMVWQEVHDTPPALVNDETDGVGYPDTAGTRPCLPQSPSEEQLAAAVIDSQEPTRLQTLLEEGKESYLKKWQHTASRLQETKTAIGQRSSELVQAIQDARAERAAKQALQDAERERLARADAQVIQTDADDNTPLKQFDAPSRLEQGYALLEQDGAEESDWDEDEDLPVEITLDEIAARRERLQSPAHGEEHEPKQTIELQDVERVIRAIKEEGDAKPVPLQTIEESDVAHVIQSIKTEPFAEVEVLDGNGQAMGNSHQAPAKHLEVIELNWTPRQSEFARQMGMGKTRPAATTPQLDKTSAFKSQPSQLETIELTRFEAYNTRTPKPHPELEIIELPYVATKQVAPKAKPTRQTIVLTEQGLETINEFGEVHVATRAMHKRPEHDDAVLKAVVQPRVAETQLIADDDIRANLLRQRLARRRGAVEVPQDLEAQVAVIPEAEVLANLAKTDSPINRLPTGNKPRNTVRDSVIPPTVRIGSEHGFKVKPETVLNQPISTRFTPFQHPELNSTQTHTASSNQAAVHLSQMPAVATAVGHLGAPSLAALQAAAASIGLRTETQSAPLEATWVMPTQMGEAEPSPFQWDEADVPVVDEEPTPEWLQATTTPSLPNGTVIANRERELDVWSAWNTQHHERDNEPDALFSPANAAMLDEAQPNSIPTAIPANVDDVSAWAAAKPQTQALQDAVASSMNGNNHLGQASAPVVPKRLASLDEYSVILPNLQLLHEPVDDSNVRPSDDLLINNGIIIEEKLAEFKVNVKVADAYAGPVITRYEIEPATGVRGSQVVNLEKDLARSLGFASIRVVETIPGKTCMGLELPNPKRQMISLASVFQAPVFQESKSKLTLVLGQDISGNPVVTDLAKAPHLLVAGTTGSGKSVGVNAMILSMLFKATPEEVRMIMIDPKMLELSIYEGIPHLLAPVVTDMKLAANALNWCVNEMEKRYRLMSHMGVRNLAGYNQKITDAQARGQRLTNPFSITPDEPDLLEKLPFIVVIVDEFADLMMTAGKKIEELIARLAQKARAAGIHLILATQRPSVDVITGLIKANIPTRIAFQVSSKIDSRTILDQMGAENLLGQGDMLFLPPGTGYPRRVHGAFVADDEVHNVVEYLKQFGEPDYIDDILTSGSMDDGGMGGAGGGGNEDDPLYDQAVKFVVSSGKTSISAVQRQMRIGYNRAARLIDQMEAAGVLSAPEHNGNRSLLVPQREM